MMGLSRKADYVSCNCKKLLIERYGWRNTPQNKWTKQSSPYEAKELTKNIIT